MADSARGCESAIIQSTRIAFKLMYLSVGVEEWHSGEINRAW